MLSRFAPSYFLLLLKSVSCNIFRLFYIFQCFSHDKISGGSFVIINQALFQFVNGNTKMLAKNFQKTLYAV